MTMTKEEMKAKVCKAIEEIYPQVEALAKDILKEPELGFKEEKTSKKVQKAFADMGLDYTTGHSITGVKATLKGKSKKYRVAMLGELDAVISPSHPYADPQTGAAHCCGHNIQIANMYAVGLGLQKSGIMEHLDGEVVLFAVPAEEFVEIEYRNKLREEGKIKYLGGKQDLIARGDFEDIDFAMQMHVTPTDNPNGVLGLRSTTNGFIGKLIKYHGKASHAAIAPDKGINALNAAMMGVMGVNAIRETLREQDYFRFHPIINHGGDLVNVVPELVTMESYVRASNLEAIVEGNKRVNRALSAGADAVGATCEIQDIPGYLPMRANKLMYDYLEANGKEIFGEENLAEDGHSTGSTEMGDVSYVMPIVHPWVGCVSGALHGADYTLTNRDVAFIKTPQVLAMTIIDLLYDEAQGADAVYETFDKVFDKDSYVEFMDKLAK